MYEDTKQFTSLELCWYFLQLQLLINNCPDFKNELQQCNIFMTIHSISKRETAVLGSARCVF